MRLFIVSIILGYLLVFFINYLPQQNDHTNDFIQKLELTWNSKIFHIHHWITFSMIILTLFIGRYAKPFIFNIVVGLFIGGIMEGFLFDDWYIISKGLSSKTIP
uniref:Uncharacterized protein n=1 Tax=viral metagenome TaxID=1070528 RepID=A0A6C0B3X6_9ZZZZ|tara:strand:+ start:197 stop:508 length:312 start_codon:yes stop_codon:yes gene_type:complete